MVIKTSGVYYPLVLKGRAHVFNIVQMWWDREIPLGYTMYFVNGEELF